MITIVIAAIALYLSAAFVQWRVLVGSPLNRLGVMAVAMLALFLHAVLLHAWIDTPKGQNLNPVTLFSFTLWVIGVLAVILALFKRVENFFIFIFPLAAISLVFGLLHPTQHIVHLSKAPKELFHIFFATFTFSMVCISGLQAFLYAWCDQRLRRKRKLKSLNKTPPLETVETLLFQMINTSFILLTVLLGASIYMFYDKMSGPIIEKTILVGLAWAAYLAVIIGRYFMGWRGARVVGFTLLGVVFLTSSFFLVTF